MKDNPYDCPQCGQDLRLGPDIYEQLEQLREAIAKLPRKYRETLPRLD